MKQLIWPQKIMYPKLYCEEEIQRQLENRSTLSNSQCNVLFKKLPESPYLCFFSINMPVNKNQVLSNIHINIDYIRQPKAFLKQIPVLLVGNMI